MEVQLRGDHPRTFRYLSLSVHAVGAVHFWFGIYYDWFYAIIPTEVSPIFNAFSYKLKFLTNWDALLQASYFTLCLANDFHTAFRKPSKEPTKLSKTKDFIMASLAFPLAMFVGVTFWGLYAVDRELVLPKALDPYFPLWLNHILHTNVVIFQLLEITTSPRTYPPKIYSVPALFGLQTAYLIWMHIVHYKTGYWVYPIFDVLNIPARIGFFAGCYAACFLFYYAGERLNRLLWGK